MPGTITLDDIHHATGLLWVDITCNRCDRRGRLRLASQIARHGGDLTVPAFLRLIAADCPKMYQGKMHDFCGVHMPELSRLFT